VAEDNRVNQTLALRLLEKHGHTAVVVGNGREALAALHRNQFDLVLMDVQMPEMDGLEATRRVRNRQSSTPQSEIPNPSIPIIAMTAHAMKGDEERCLAVGMNGYVTKPIRADALFEAIESCLGDRPPVSPPGRSVIDRDKALASVDGDTELLRELAGLFLGDCPTQMAAIGQAIATGDAAGLRSAAHALKGAACNFGAKAVTDAALKLEILGRDSQLAGAGAACSALEAEMEHLELDLTALAQGDGSDQDDGSLVAAEE